MEATNNHNPDFKILEQGKDTKKTVDLIANWSGEFTKRIKTQCNSKKLKFTFTDAIERIEFHTKRDECFLTARNFLYNNPINQNDYVKYVSAYAYQSIKLDLKYFKYNVDKLEGYYKKVDEAKANDIKFNPFNTLNYKNYVLFMVLKLQGEFSPTDNELFNVELIDFREYNPLTKIPSVIRGLLPFNVKEYDIKRAFPTFIDIELNSNYRHTIYDLIDKKKFAIILNSNSENPANNIKSLQESLKKVYGSDAGNVLTNERFEVKGKAFLDFSRHEKDFITQFVESNNIINYVRLHDGVFVLQDVECKKLTFGIVEFAIKECIRPLVENSTINFYKIDASGIETSRTLYADFLIQENFKRISTPDDKILLLRDTNNVVDYFNHKTNIVSFLVKNIAEFGTTYNEVKEVIAKENNTIISNSFTLIDPIELKYYSDTKNTFGLPFKNGFFYIDFNADVLEVKQKDYKEVSGFFSPHKIQARSFKYIDDEISVFEQFLTRASTGKYNERDMTESDFQTRNEFFKMFGYLCHTYKSQTASPCVILTDEDANDENRNGRRGKTLLTKAISEVHTTMLKGGNEFDANYTHVFADLEKKHKVYIIDDVPASFKYDDLYTNILGGINCQRKGVNAELIPFEESPKFVITSNWVIRYDENNASTNKRFLEYKFTNYYNQNYSPEKEFKNKFFEDWNADEWNKFYSFAFKCVGLYINDGLEQIKYNKTKDNYLALFNNVSMSDEFERIINELLSTRTEFGVNDFLGIYDKFDNPLRVQRFFNKNNVKRLIDVWFSNNPAEYVSFKKSKRKWFRNAPLP